MERTLFRKEMEREQECSLKFETVMENGLKYFDNKQLPEPYGVYNLRIAIEEIAELTEAITESMLNLAYDRYGVLEELADVFLSCFMLGIALGKREQMEFTEEAFEESNTFGWSALIQKLECIKHLSGLSMSLSKYLRKPEQTKEDDLIRQANQILKDVKCLIALEYFTKDDLEKAINIKVNRLQKNIISPDYY